MKISFAKLTPPAQGVVVIAVPEAAKSRGTKAAKGSLALGPAGAALDRRLGGAISRAAGAADFTGKREKSIQLLSPGDGKISRVVVIGLGDPSMLDVPATEAIGAAIYTAISR